MAKMWWLIGAVVAFSCDVTLVPSFPSLDLWGYLNYYAYWSAPVVVCLAGSAPDRVFVLDNLWTACRWGSTDVTVQNVVISGRRRFKADCDRDWCTHCLTPYYFVHRDSGSETVIDHIPLLSIDSNYFDSTQCIGHESYPMFIANIGAELVFEDCTIVDLRSRMHSFVALNGGSLSFVRTEVRNMDFAVAFLYALSWGSGVSFSDSYVTGLNRDHPYLRGNQLDTSLLNAGSFTIGLTVQRSVFEDNFLLEAGALTTENKVLIIASVSQLTISDSVVRHCTGGLLFEVVSDSGASLLVANTTFEENHSESSPLFSINSYNYVHILLSDVKWTRNTCTTSMLKAMLYSGSLELENNVFTENQIIGSSDQLIYFMYVSSFFLANSTFTENGQMQSKQPWLWDNRLTLLGVFDEYSLDFGDSNSCYRLIYFLLVAAPSVYNVTIDGSGETACMYLITGDNLFMTATGSAGNFELLRTTVPTSNVMFLYWTLFAITATVNISDSVFERAASFLSFSSPYPYNLMVSLNIANSVFRDSMRNGALGIPIAFIGVAAVLRNCSFLNNDSIYSALSLNVPYCDSPLCTSLEVRNCYFRNNTSVNLSADIDVFGEGWMNVFIHNSMFLDSKALGLGGSLTLTMVPIRNAEVSNCSFAGATNGVQGVVRLAHSLGSVVLSALQFHSIASPETVLVYVDASNSVGFMEAVIVDSAMINCTFSAGISLSAGATVESRNNSYLGNTGTLVWNKRGLFADTESTYSGNKAQQGCLWVDSGAQAKVRGSVFVENTVSGNIGVIYAQGPGCSVQVHSCEFRNNTSTGSAGVILVLGSAALSVSHSRFVGNSAQGPSVLKIQQNNITAEITSTQLLRNTAMIQLVDSSLRMKDVELAEEHFASVTGAIVLIRSELLLEQSTVQYVTGERGCLATGISGSLLSLRRVTVHAVACGKEIVALSSNSTLRLIDTAISETGSAQLSAVSLSTGNLHLHNVTIAAASAIRTFFKVSNANANLSYTDYYESDVTMLIIENGGHITIEHCTFADINSRETGTAGAIQCVGCSSVEIWSSDFRNITASSVAAVSANTQRFVTQNCSFRDLKANDYGALYIVADDVRISDSLFDSNTAIKNSSSGGAVTISSLNSEISHCMMVNNTANVGGAVRWMNTAPRFFGNVFKDNLAEYGTDIASYADRLQIVTNPLPVLASGQTFKGQLVVHILDHQSEVIRNDNSSRAMMSGDALTGSVQSSALMGVFIFTEFVLIEMPGTSTNVTIALSGTSLNNTLMLELRRCIGGEVLSEKRCVVCPLDTYSFDIYSGKCSFCVDHADCHDGQIYPKPGYWRADNLSEEVMRCPLQEACLGALNTSTTGVCSDLYTGNLCQTCVDSATRSGKDRCKECLSNSVEIVRLVLVALAMSVFLLSLSIFAQKADSHVGVMLKVLLNYAHLTMLVAQFELDWPEELHNFFRIYEYLGNSVEQLLSFDCTSEALLKKVIAAAVLPACLFIALAVLWSAAKVFKKCSNDLLLSSWIVSLCYSYPFVIRTALSLFECISIRPEEQWVRLELGIRCWDHSHSYYALAAALPTLVLWGIGFPALAFLYLKRNNPAKRSAAFLYIGYRSGYLHWELLILLRKSSIVVLYVLLSNIALALQGLFLCVVLCVAAELQSRCSAFELDSLNGTELRGIYVSLLTAFCGLCLGASLSSLAEKILFALIVMAHFYYLTLWTIALASRVCPKLLSKAKFISRLVPIASRLGSTAIHSSALPPFLRAQYLHKLRLQHLKPATSLLSSPPLE